MSSHLDRAVCLSARAFLGVAFAATLMPCGYAQGDRVHLLARLNSYDGGGGGGFDYNDVFGYHAPDGREIAILGVATGTSFVETTDPFLPVELKFIGRNASLWSDMAVWQTYVYTVTEAGGGLQIIDISNLDDIKLVTTYTGAFNSAHSLWIDTTRGHAYICGSDVGMPILDLASPTAPTLITTYTNQYVHEATAQNGLAHLSEIYTGDYRLVDVSNLPTITTLDKIKTPANFTHSSTVNATDTFTGVLDEVAGSRFVLYDITDRSNIVQRGTYVEKPAGLLHNVFMVGDAAYFSGYAEGFVCIDLRNPDRLKKLGSYDTWSGASGGYNGAWGVYPQPSGTIYISNIEDGLWVLCRATQTEHSGLPDTLAEAGPYVAIATITPSAYGGGITSATLHYTFDDGANVTDLTLAPTGNPNEYAASIPGQPNGTTVQYWIDASDGLGTSNAPVDPSSRFVFSVGERTLRYFEDFDGATDGGWTHGTTTGTDDWQRGVPGRRYRDPYLAFSGSNVFGNDLGNGTNGTYDNNVDSWLESPAIDLTGVHGTRLRFQRWLRVEDGAFDQAKVLVNGVVVWSNPSNGSNLATKDKEWVTFDVNVSALADGVANTRVRFTLTTNGSNAFGGWNVDDVELYSVSTCHAPVNYGNGTAGSGGFVPTLTAANDPTIGNPSFEIDSTQILGGAPGFLVLGFGRALVPFHGIELLVDLSQPFLLVSVQASGPAGVPGAGTLQMIGSIPNDQDLLGLEIDCQLIVIDSGGPRGLAASPGLAIMICD